MQQVFAHFGFKCGDSYDVRGGYIGTILSCSMNMNSHNTSVICMHDEDDEQAEREVMKTCNVSHFLWPIKL